MTTEKRREMPGRRPLQHPEDVVEALCWLQAGAPAASRDYDAPRCVSVLRKLVEALPAYLPVYSCGSAQWSWAIGSDSGIEKPPDAEELCDLLRLAKKAVGQ